MASQPRRSKFSEFFGNQAVSNLREGEEAFGGLADRFAASVANVGDQRRELAAGTSSAIASKFRNQGGGPRGFARNLEQAVRKAKARSQIGNRGDKAIANQQLKDRITLARKSIGRHGAIAGAIGTAGRQRTAISNAEQAADDSVNQAKFGAIGGIVGGGLSKAIDSGLFKFKGAEIDPLVDRGTAFSDQIGSNGPFGFVNNPRQRGVV